MLIRESTMAWNKMRKEILISAILFFISSCLMVQADETTGNKIYVAETDPRYTGIGILCEYRLSEDGMIEEMLVYNYKHEPPTIEEAINSEEKNLIQRYYVKKKDNVITLFNHDYEDESEKKKKTISIESEGEIHLSTYGNNSYSIKIRTDNTSAFINFKVFENEDLLYCYESNSSQEKVHYPGVEMITYLEKEVPQKVVWTHDEGCNIATIEQKDSRLFEVNLYGDEVASVNNYGTVYLLKEENIEFSFMASILNYYLMDDFQTWYLYTFFKK
jgi:hypothetical protein